jgi:hypothetical protein
MGVKPSLSWEKSDGVRARLSMEARSVDRFMGGESGRCERGSKRSRETQRTTRWDSSGRELL